MIKERILEYLAVKNLKMNRRPRILIVDDEEIVRKNLTHYLLKDNYVVVSVSNGMEALKKMGSAQFDVILTDLKMDHIDGIEILKRTKAKHPYTEVVMITGYATIDSAVESMKHGAFHYLAKPFKLEDVKTVVRQAIEKKNLRKETKGLSCAFPALRGQERPHLENPLHGRSEESFHAYHWEA